jgi:hypothetical protein
LQQHGRLQKKAKAPPPKSKSATSRESTETRLVEQHASTKKTYKLQSDNADGKVRRTPPAVRHAEKPEYALV